MAAPPRIITLNLGSQTIGLAEFQVQPHGGLVLQNYRLREMPADPTGEGMRYAQMTAALREMMNELGITGGEVNFAVAGQSVFTRFVKLPAVEAEKIERIISFEAQQNVPFPIDEVVWDYQLVGAGTDEQIQVVLVAIKSDLLDEINESVETTGLSTAVVDVAPMALYNAFRYSYSDLTGCSLLVDIGARTTNLLFVEPGKIFSRSVPIGGSSITAAIAKEFGEPFTAAEFRKKRAGFVSLGGAYAEPSDVDVARVSKIVRSTMTRLHAELMRSISHYRAQQQGNGPDRVLLCGGSASMPYMREFFYEKLQIPIEFLNPLRNVAVADTAPVNELMRSAHLLGELVGLALRSVTTCPMELNLRPAKVTQRYDLRKRRIFLIAAAACVLLGLLGWSAYYMRAAQQTRHITAQLDQKIDLMHAAEAQLDTLRKQINALDTVGTPLIAAVNDRSFWPQLLEDLNARLPKENIWITELVATSGGKPIGADESRAKALAPPPTPTPAAAGARGKTVAGKPAAPAIDGILIRGLYLFNPKQQDVVVDYFRNLAGSPFFNIDPKNQSRVIKSSIPNNKDWGFDYELRLDLRKPLTLP